ncbi:hypothetical protein [Aliivibrio fischeri]|uniref:hypothetical protein n=1 Tax=Aliivibrio fischeri TaxID=668 RepID=UPI00080DFE41|nr:hypothetical protein [Aliivibrio fischeri]OCH48792.1 hypothetical protein A6E02_08125 [Aliivibrio fischeri]
MNIGVVVNVIKSPKAMSNYSSFYTHIFSNGEFVFSKKEKKKIREFYYVVKSLPPSKRVNLAAFSKLQFLMDELDFESAKKRSKGKFSKPASKNKKPTRKKSKKLQKPTIQEIIQSQKNLPTIGMGLKSVITVPKVRLEDVVIDAHTKQKKSQDKHILYVAGWSLNDSEDDGLRLSD